MGCTCSQPSRRSPRKLQTSCEQDEVFTNSSQLAKVPLQDPSSRQVSPQEAIQARMKRPEGSALSQVYQKHIQKEKNLMLELKITTLQQENEDLHFRAQNRAAMARQLWEDLLLGLEETQDCTSRRSSSRRRSR
uniref:Uncharacterized protein n=1 Tax=Jaculus jaculus TaxID=51337 RepID=A0A8C5NUN5_JACJA